MTAELLFDQPFVVVFPPGHGLERIHWSDLFAHPLIALQGQFTERLPVDLQVALHEPVLRRKVLAYDRAAGTLSPAAQGFKAFLFAHVAAQAGCAGKARAKATLRG